jgi:hypothetical protein
MKKGSLLNGSGILLISIIVLFTFSCQKDTPIPTPPPENASSEVVHQWFSLALELIKTTPGMTPPVAARALGYMGVTSYESVVKGYFGFISSAGQLSDLDPSDLPQVSNDLDYSWPQVANAALAIVVENLFFNATPVDKFRIYELRTRLDDVYSTQSDFQARIRSAELGRAIGNAIIKWASEDPIGHQSQLKNFPSNYIPPTGPEKWVPTGSQAIPLQPYWGNARTFVPNCAALTQPPKHLDFDVMPGSRFYLQAKEVYDVSQTLDAEQKTIAEYWADGSGTITPPGHSVSIALQLIQKEKLDLINAALLMARTGIAVNDAFVSCWRCKYTFNLMRPQTYIQKFIAQEWKPLIATPPFPEYTSGHSSQSGAAATVFSQTFGPNYVFTDSTHHRRADINGKPRSFAGFDAIAQEAAISRLYGGIHYTMGNEQGLAQGRAIGKEVMALRFKL